MEGNGIYSTENGTFTVTISNTLTVSQNIVWYADGALLAENEGYTVADNVYTFKGVSTGEHYFVGIVYEEGKEASIGSIQLTISVVEPEFKLPSHFAYTDNGDGICTITGENPDYPLETHEGLIIPDEINGLKVTKIGAGSFRNKGFSGSLIISDNVTEIETYSFYQNSFSYIKLGANLRIIEDYSFQFNKLRGDLIIPDNVETIGVSAFANNVFSGTLKLSEKLGTINDAAFEGNTFTGDLVIPIKVGYIGLNALYNNQYSRILCKVSSQPAGWDAGWNNGCGAEVIWGYTSD